MVDADGDGYPAGIDCNDTLPFVHPGAPEICNNVDDDCDGTRDGQAALEYCQAPERTLPHAVMGCFGSCELIGCDPGFRDCGGLSADGCETDTTSDPRNCGECYAVCEGTCTDGVCGGGA
jgi:hypothetical protein